MGSGGEVDQRTGIVFDREWRRILNANKYYRWGERTATTDSQGRVALTDLTSSAGTNDVERVYRVFGVMANNRVYEEVTFDDVPMGTRNNYASFVWYRVGDYIQLLPVDASIEATIWVNHLPCRPDLLAADTDIVNFPDGYEDVVAYDTASLLLSKGGAETGAASELAALAEMLRQDMLQDFARFSTKPSRFKSDDSPGDWAG